MGVLTMLLLAAAGASASQPQQSFWSLVVNDAAKGEILIAIDGNETWIPVAALEKAGLKQFEGERRELFGEPHVRMGSLEPEIRLQRDMAEVVLRIFAAPRFFDVTVVTLQRDRPDGIAYTSTPSLYSNYAIDWDETAGTTGYGGSALSLFGNTTLQSSYSVEPGGRFVRGLSSLTIDRRTATQRLIVGDLVARATPLGSSPIIGGVQFGRDYRLDPYYFRYPSASFRGTVTTRSDVEVYVNNTRVREFEIGPGPFRLDRLPINSGLADVRIVVRDPLGREQIFDSSYYQSVTVLQRGEHDYQYSAGLLRDDDADQPIYTDWVGSAYHKVGLTNWLTIGYSAEGSEQVVSGGPSIAVRFPRIGDVQVDGWVTETKDGVRGVGGYGLYSFISRFVNLSALAQYYDDGFANVFVLPGDVGVPELYQLTVGAPLWRLGGITYTGEQKVAPATNYSFILPPSGDDEKVPVRQHTLRLNVNLPLRSQLTVSGRYTRIRDVEYWSGFAGVTAVIGRLSTASVSYSRRDQEEGQFVEISRSLPVGPGVGFRVNASDHDGGTGTAQLELNTRFNRMRVKYDVFESGTSHNTAFNLTGGVAINKGGLFLTRPLDSSGAIVEVKGLRNVGILVDNIHVGRTGRNGRLLVNDLLPFMANRIGFVESDLPFDYTVPESMRLVAPPFRGAAYVLFDTKRVQGRSGRVRLLIDGSEVVPSFGTIAVDAVEGPLESPLNQDGEFFFDLPNGKHTATVTFKGASCTVAFEARTGSDLIQPLGTLTCTP
jgi:outer membrane usher protein